MMKPPDFIRQASAVRSEKSTVRSENATLELGVWNIQDFGGGPSGKWIYREDPGLFGTEAQRGTYERYKARLHALGDHLSTLQADVLILLEMKVSAQREVPAPDHNWSPLLWIIWGWLRPSYRQKALRTVLPDTTVLYNAKKKLEKADKKENTAQAKSVRARKTLAEHEKDLHGPQNLEINEEPHDARRKRKREDPRLDQDTLDETRRTADRAESELAQARELRLAAEREFENAQAPEHRLWAGYFVEATKKAQLVAPVKGPRSDKECDLILEDGFGELGLAEQAYLVMHILDAPRFLVNDSHKAKVLAEPERSLLKVELKEYQKTKTTGFPTLEYLAQLVLRVRDDFVAGQVATQPKQGNAFEMLKIAMERVKGVNWAMSDPGGQQEMIAFICRNSWKFVKCTPHSMAGGGNESWRRPTYELHFELEGKGKKMTILAVHAPSPAHIKESKGWYEKLNEIAEDKYQKDKQTPIYLIGDLNLGQDLVEKTLWCSEFFDPWWPLLEKHAELYTSVKMSGTGKEMWSQSYDKILQWKAQVTEEYSYEFRKADNVRWTTAEAVRKYSDHSFLLFDRFDKK